MMEVITKSWIKASGLEFAKLLAEGTARAEEVGNDVVVGGLH